MHIANYAVTLKRVTEQDCERVWQWRNMPHVRLQMTNQQSIPWDDHQIWFKNMLVDNCQRHFVIYYKEQPIGVINVKSEQPIENANRAEIGVYISDTHFLSNLIAFAPSLALIDYLFNELNVKELYSEVRRENTAAIRYNQQLGYQLADHPTNQALVNISLTHDDYFHATPKLKSFLNRG
ncbi:GNAT family N-acetyltransferase [Pseudoalteromonas gelatinilytica]